MNNHDLSIHGPSTYARQLAHALRDGFRVHALLYLFALIVLMAAVLELRIVGLPLDLQMVMLFTGPVLIVLMIMVLGGLAAEMIRLARSGYRGSVMAALSAKLRNDYFAPIRVANGLHAAVFMTIYMSGYTFIRRAIPLANPFSWDPIFSPADRYLHFGSHPYEWVAPVLNHTWITFLLNVNYNAWFFVMFACWFWQGFGSRDTELRQRFLLGFTLTWFLGTCVLGTIFSSVGPCFYGRLISGEDPYAPLMTWLQTANGEIRIWSLNVMDKLWASYESGNGLVNGITAMPSMHVGTSILFVLLGFASGYRKLGWALSCFALLIFIGSIHLGWHYAIDGYAGAAVAGLGWWAAGVLVRWDRKLRAAAGISGENQPLMPQALRNFSNSAPPAI
ncbi:phosphatase PAP2 family protein [Aestuariivirga sp.]|uniref:phosphatase PAP2 family protein n=1 Tax=Aestuariivirga sp. TaxID=2650926 RepID=UPI0039E3AA84